MNEALLTRIRDDFCKDQDAILLRLKNYARTMLGDSPDAYGFTDDDVIGEAIRRTLDPECKRTWNPDKCDLPTYLCGVVRSILSNKDLWKKRDRDAVNFQAEIPGNWNPEEERCESVEERAELQMRAVEETIQDDLELATYFIAVKEGAESAPEIAVETGFPVGRVYELKRKLLKLAPIIRERFRTLLTQAEQ